MVDAAGATGRIGMGDDRWPRRSPRFRQFNYEHIYLRPASVAQAEAVIAVLRALVEHYADRPEPAARRPPGAGVDAGSAEALRAAVTYVAGMTDRFACQQAVALLGWDPVAAGGRRHVGLRPLTRTRGSGRCRSRRRVAESSRAVRARGVGSDVDDLAAPALAELHRAVGQREQRVVAAAADVAGRGGSGCRAGAR